MSNENRLIEEFLMSGPLKNFKKHIKELQVPVQIIHEYLNKRKDINERDYRRYLAMIEPQLAKIDLYLEEENGEKWIIEAKKKLNFKAIGQLKIYSYLKYYDDHSSEELKVNLNLGYNLAILYYEEDLAIKIYALRHNIHLFQLKDNEWYHFKPLDLKSSADKQEWESIKQNLNVNIKEKNLEFPKPKKYQKLNIMPKKMVYFGDLSDIWFIINDLKKLNSVFPFEIIYYDYKEEEAYYKEKIVPNAQLIAKLSNDQPFHVFKSGRHNISLTGKFTILDDNDNVIWTSPRDFTTTDILDMVNAIIKNKGDCYSVLESRNLERYNQYLNDNETALIKKWVNFGPFSNKNIQFKRLIINLNGKKRMLNDLFFKYNGKYYVFEAKQELNWELIGQLLVYSWFFQEFNKIPENDIIKGLIYKESLNMSIIIEDFAYFLGLFLSSQTLNPKDNKLYWYSCQGQKNQLCHHIYSGFLNYVYRSFYNEGFNINRIWDEKNIHMIKNIIK